MFDDIHAPSKEVRQAAFSGSFKTVIAMWQSSCSAGKHRARRQAVVADDPPGLAHHEGARPAFDFVVQAMSFQPLIERLDAGREGIELVILTERLRRREPR